MQQPWFQKRAEYGLGQHLVTEEGLAVLHDYLARKDKRLWIQALYYYTVCQGSRMSFSQLFKDLEKYVDDKDRRWKFCLRVKRGSRDTSTHEVFTKDQVYLRGLIKVMTWLETHNYQVEDLYLGKIDIQDLNLIRTLNPTKAIELPRFLADQKKYHQEAEQLKKVNNIHSIGN